MMTSYVVAHLNVRRTITETLGSGPQTLLPTNIYLTNTLSPPHSSAERGDQISLFDFSAAITDEAYRADTWKSRRPIKVIIGNPPYLAASTNPFDISAYKAETDGVTKLDEKNSKWLGDDYVKFFRFAEQIINANNEGILAFVSNNGFLDNITFRGMRASLLRSFDKIFVVNLHGSTNKLDTTPDGGKDENIFDIKTGVSLTIGVKNPPVAAATSPFTRSTLKGAGEIAWAKVFYSDLWGTREQKFSVLDTGEIEFTELQIDEKIAYFVPFGSDEQKLYEKGVNVAKLFADNVVGIVTARDSLCIQNSRKDIESVLKEFQTKDTEQLRSQYKLGADTRDWTVEGAKKDIETLDGNITRILYRPFDYRYTYFTGRSKGFHCMPRGKLMKHLLSDSKSPIGKNIGIVIVRGDTTPHEFSMVFVSDKIIDNGITAAQQAGIASIAPLYLHNEIDNTWSPNFDPETLARLTEHMTFQPSPIEIFDYIYGILYDPVYRERFNEFLKRDFPRVPVVNSPSPLPQKGGGPAGPGGFSPTETMFRAYVSAGERLRKLHLMQIKTPAALEIDPNTPDNLEIGAIKYKNGVLHLNADKRILGIPENVWGYRIGGYQVLDKWFKSHKGETITADSFDHIANVAGLLAETIKIQEELIGLH